jgi:hypothetical protein
MYPGFTTATTYIPFAEVDTLDQLRDASVIRDVQVTPESVDVYKNPLDTLAIKLAPSPDEDTLFQLRVASVIRCLHKTP